VYLGIDYGEKRIGLAISDEMNKIALGVGTYSRDEVIIKIKELMSSKEIRGIIVGYPQKGDFLDSWITKRVNAFVDLLRENFTNLEIITLDESVSTQLAIQELKRQGYSDKSIEKMKDMESARVILQTYLGSI
jgi:putative Holliday junction resolvase